MKKTTQRSYTPEQKLEAVTLAQEVGAKAAAKQLGYPEDTLYTWMARAKKGALPSPSAPSDTSAPLDENARLKEEIRALKAVEKSQKAEIEQLRKERQILEDATTFLQVARRNE